MKSTGQLKRRTRLRRHGARHLRDREAANKFRRVVIERARGRCERCGEKRDRLEAHHIVPRSRAPGWEGLHKVGNGAALCGACHAAVHAHTARDWRAWLRKAVEVCA